MDTEDLPTLLSSYFLLDGDSEYHLSSVLVKFHHFTTLLIAPMA